MNLRDYLKVIQQRWILVTLSVLVAAGVMFLATPAVYDTNARVGSYSATAVLLVESEGGQRPSLGRIALFITAGDVPARVAEQIAYDGTPARLASTLSVQTDADSDSITIATTSSDGERAAQVANAFAQESVRFFTERPDGGDNTRIVILQEASPIPNEATSGFVLPPDRASRVLLAAGLGLLFGILLALTLDRLDSRLRTRSEVTEAMDLPVIGDIPLLPRGERRDGEIVTVSKPLGAYADGYRAARTAITHVPTERGAVQVVVVTSGQEADGKSTSAANLAATFAETGRSVLVLDADLRSPDLHHKFDVPQGAGVSDWLADSQHAELAALARPTDVDGVRIITAGTRLEHPASLASRLGPLVAEARTIADVIVIDTAPLLAAADVFDILPLADTVALVARSGRLTTANARRVADLLARFKVPVAGVLLVGAPMRKGDYGYGYGNGYGYGEGKYGAKRAAPAASGKR